MSKRQPKITYWKEAPMPREQLVLFTETLEQRIPEDHPVRILDEILARMSWKKWEAEYHGRRGQPPIHPSVMCRVLLFAMIRRIRSSRQIEYNLQHSIDFMWLAGGRSIDHSTLSDFAASTPNSSKTFTAK
jgi:transposase